MSSTLILVGNLGQDPKSFQAGNSSGAEISVADEVRVKKADKTWDKFTRWYSASFFGHRGENVMQYLRKGSKVQVIGEVVVRQYVTNDGQSGTAYEIHDAAITFLSDFGRQQADGGGGQSQGGAPFGGGQQGGGQGDHAPERF